MDFMDIAAQQDLLKNTSLSDLAAAAGMLSQASRFITLELEADAPLLLAAFAGREGINTESQFALDCVSQSGFIDLTTLVGKSVRLGIATDDGSRRYWQGVVSEASSQGSDGSLARYQLLMTSALSQLKARRNSLIFQDKTALDIATELLANYPQLTWRHELKSQLEPRPITTQFQESDFDFFLRLLSDNGLSWRIEHNQDASLDEKTAGHTLVIFDADTSLALPTGTPAKMRFHRVDATEKEDSITAFNAHYQLAADQVTTSSWDPAQLQSISGNAKAASLPEAPLLPSLERFDTDGSERYANRNLACADAERQLQAERLLCQYFQGQGAQRRLQPGHSYTLTDHAQFEGQAFVPLWVEHHATNNLATDLHRQDQDASGSSQQLGKASYRQRFVALPAGLPIVPEARPRPLAPACCTAKVVGLPDGQLTSNRDHQARIQFYWQRGAAPLAGGDSDTHDAGAGHATGDHTSGTWVRLAEASAGANSGASFVARIGNEVLVEFAQGDIDQPLIVGQLYNHTAPPPWAAGVDGEVNHPGTLSGVHSHNLDGVNHADWVLDDATGQARQRLHHDSADSQLQLGYLIEQQGSHRGRYLGEGVALTSAGWTQLRAASGLLLSASARPMGQSTQMDASEAVAQLKAAQALSDQLDSAASAGGGTSVGSQPHVDLLALTDPNQQGKYTAKVGAQDSKQPNGEPVARFDDAALLLDSPASIALTSPRSSTLFAGEAQQFSSQSDTQIAASASLALAAGNSASFYTTDGGAKVIANHGPVSLGAHDDALHIMADKDATISSSGDSISVLANQQIQLTAGGASITLQGGNITLSAPAGLKVNTATHNWLAGEGQAASLPSLPTGLASAVAISAPAVAALASKTAASTAATNAPAAAGKATPSLVKPPNWIEIGHSQADGSAFADQGYTIKFTDGSELKGKLDAQGKARHDKVPDEVEQVTYDPIAPQEDAKWPSLDQLISAAKTRLK